MSRIILYISSIFFTGAGCLNQTQKSWLCLVLLAKLSWESRLCISQLKLEADCHTIQPLRSLLRIISLVLVFSVANALNTKPA